MSTMGHDPNLLTRTAVTHLVLREVAAERARQHAKWGEQNHPDGTGGHPLHRDTDANLDLLTSGELARIFRWRCELRASRGEVTWRDIFLEEVFEGLDETEPEKLRAELVQVAAVCAAWVEAIDRREAGAR